MGNPLTDPQEDSVRGENEFGQDIATEDSRPDTVPSPDAPPAEVAVQVVGARP